MNELKEVEGYRRFPLREVYEFLSQKGLEKEANEIAQLKDKPKVSTITDLKRGKDITILEKHGLLPEFIDIHWPHGRTEKGKRLVEKYRRIYDLFLNRDRTEEEDEEERIEETSFAYEEDLRDYLSNNLLVIEPGLKLFKDENGVEGIEYPIDANNKRVDILAIDKSDVPVIIELKVSRGYERVIGQCLYYKNRVKQVLNSAKVRIIIIAREITPQLEIATEDLPGVELFEYKLSVTLERARRISIGD